MLNKAYKALAMFAAAVIISAGLYYGLAGEELSEGVYPGRISFGERAIFKVTARGPSDAGIEILDDKEVLDGFVRLKDGASRERIFLWRKRKEAWWLFTSEITGERQIPSVTVKFTDPKTQLERSIRTEPVPITVKSLVNLKEDAIYTARIGGDLVTGTSASGSGGGGRLNSVDGDIRIRIEDERSPLGVVDKNELLVTAGVSFLGAVIVYLIFSMWSRRKPKKVTIPPDKALLARLTALKSRLESGIEGKRELYYELSSSLREYLKAIMHITAEEPTTKDMIELIDKEGAIEPDKRMFYKELLSECDRVKYSASVNSDTEKLPGYIRTLLDLAAVVPAAAEKGRKGARS